MTSKFVHVQESLTVRPLAAPETNLFLFAFLLNFVYEAWQSPFYEFYASPSLAAKIVDLTHCSFGDSMIILFSSWGVGAFKRSRCWLMKPGWRLTALFSVIGLVIETYRVNVSKSYGVSVLAVPILGMSALAVIQWIILPPVILYLARRHMKGYAMDSLQ